MEPVNAAILAGGVNRVALYEGYEPGYKALLPIAGKPCIQYTLDALRACEGVGRICVVGPREVVSDDGELEFEAPGERLVDSMAAGLRHFADSKWVLMTTADLPLMTAEAVTEFLCAASGAPLEWHENVLISAVPASCFTGDFAPCAKDMSAFRDVKVCHGNLMLVDPRILSNALARERMNELYSARKNPFKAAMAVGLRVGLSYVFGVLLFHALTMRTMAGIASKRFHIGIVPVLVDRPEIAVDIDEASDYQLVTSRLGGS